MRPQKGGAASASTETTPTPKQQCHPGTPVKKSKGFVHLSTRTAKVNAVGTPRTAPRFPIRSSDALAWSLFTLIVGVILIAICVLVTLGAPS